LNEIKFIENAEQIVSLRKNILELKETSFLSSISRREFIKCSAAAVAASLIVGCNSSLTKPEPIKPRLSARPGTPTMLPTKGLTKLGLNTGRDGVMYVPREYSPDRATPLFVAMHGAGGVSSDWARYYMYAENLGIIFLAPDSRGASWDMIYDDYGPDLEFLDKALKYVFERCNIDPTRLLLGGFSDGASYALSLGVSNGDLFSHLIGYSQNLFIGPIQ